MLLSNQQKRDFYDNGYLCLPNAVSSTVVDSALRSINHSLGEEGMNKEELPTLRAQSYCREIRESPSITNLINQSQLIGVMDDLLGVDNLGPIKSGQIALRFPRFPRLRPEPSEDSEENEESEESILRTSEPKNIYI